MPSPLLQIRDASKYYYSGGFLGEKKSVVALDNFNLTIEESPATITTIAGESGSGKTTLANSFSASSNSHRARSFSMAKISPI